MALPLRKALVGGQATGRFAAPRKNLCRRHTAGAGFHKNLTRQLEKPRHIEETFLYFNPTEK
jgi:hypothetical protein